MTDPAGDRAGRAYWESLWRQRAPLLRRLPDGRIRLSRTDRRFAALFRRLGVLDRPAEKRLLEVGSAGSTWLPWFAEQGFAVTGIDYSPAGCESARALLREQRVDGEVVCADALAPPDDLLRAFDVVLSFGVLEHFQDTVGTLAAFARFLRPRGLLVTIVPNMAGWTGTVQRLLAPEVFATHVPLTVAELVQAHRGAGLECECGYFMSVNFGVVALTGLEPERLSTRIKQGVVSALAHASKLVWVLEDRLRLPATPALAPYLVCVARVGSAAGAVARRSG